MTHTLPHRGTHSLSAPCCGTCASADVARPTTRVRPAPTPALADAGWRGVGLLGGELDGQIE
ncbi:MAG TPA: hypothetical protein VF916_05990, partial [Ktedonobacterales bacterium]